jgi:hypothetical protein
MSRRARALAPAIVATALAAPVGCQSAVDAPQDEVIGSAASADGDGPMILTHHNDVGRTGANLSEKVLRPDNLSTFGEDFCWKVDGKVWAQPLYIGALATPSGTKNVAFVATGGNSVYALDADDRTGADKTSPYLGACRAVVDADVHHLWKWDGPSEDYPPAPYGIGTETGSHPMGIVSTPVIDRPRGRIYFVTRTGTCAGAATRCYFDLHALSITTGAPLFHNRIEAVVVTSTGRALRFSDMADAQKNRPALLLAGNTVFLAFGSERESDWPMPEYHGWVLAYDVAGDVPRSVRAWVSTPDWVGGGIWQGGNGLSYDGSGVYFMTGNGANRSTETITWTTMPAPPTPVAIEEPGPTSNQDAFLRLDPVSMTTTRYTPTFTAPGAAHSSFACRDMNDMDFGTSSPMLLPGVDAMIGGGREGVLYAVTRSTMKLIGTTPLGPPLVYSDPCFSSAYFRQTNLYGAPVFWHWSDASGAHDSVYVWPQDFGETLTGGNPSGPRRFEWTGASGSPLRFVTSRPDLGAIANGYRIGGVIALSANGADASSGVLWGQTMNDTTKESYLVALDARTLADAMTPIKLPPASITPFSTPTVIDGKVFLSGADGFESSDQGRVHVFRPNPPCIPSSDPCAGASCGVVSDGCGLAVCGFCRAGQTCSRGSCVTPSCCPTACTGGRVCNKLTCRCVLRGL